MGDSQKISSLVTGGAASAGPPLGPALGPLGVNIMEIINAINEKTKDFEGMKVPVTVSVDTDTKKWDITIGIPSASALVLKEVGIQKGSGTSGAEWVMETYRREMPKVPRAICFGGTHYPEKFTKMVLQGEYALGTIVPKHSLEYIDESMFSHILKSNPDTSTVLLDSGGLGKFKTDIISMAEASNLEVVKL